MKLQRINDLIAENLGGGDENDLAAFQLACWRYIEEQHLDPDDTGAQALAIDAIWGDGDFVPRVRQYVPDY